MLEACDGAGAGARQQVGWRTFFCGPESFTPDDQFHIGESPRAATATSSPAGLNSVGIQMFRRSRQGMCRVDASRDTRRSTSGATTSDACIRSWVRRPSSRSGSAETLGLLYAQPLPAPPVRELARRCPPFTGARAAGLEHGRAVSARWPVGSAPNWFAQRRRPTRPMTSDSFGKPELVLVLGFAEHAAAREGVALFDQSTAFRSIWSQGRDACAGAAADLLCECRRRARTAGLHPLAERARRH